MEYGRYSSPALVEFTHAKGTPWEKVYNSEQRGIEISDKSLKEYFSAQKPLQTFILPEVPESDYIGYRNSDGILVLPKEYDDEAE